MQMVHEEGQAFFWEALFSRNGFGFHFQKNTHTHTLLNLIMVMGQIKEKKYYWLFTCCFLPKFLVVSCWGVKQKSDWWNSKRPRVSVAQVSGGGWKEEKSSKYKVNFSACLPGCCCSVTWGSAHSWAVNTQYKFFIELDFSDLPIIICPPGTWKCLWQWVLYVTSAWAL